VFQEKPKRFEELVCSVLSQRTCKGHRNEFTAQVVHLDSYGTSMCKAYIIQLLCVRSTLVSPVSIEQMCENRFPKWLINKSKQLITRIQTFALFCMMYSFFWVIPRRLSFICRRFRTPYLFHLHKWHHLWRWNRRGVPKRRHIKFRPRRITKRKNTTNNQPVNRNQSCKIWILTNVLTRF